VTVAVVTVVVTAAFLGTLVFDTGSRGRPENLVLDDQTVARTAYQPLIDPRQIVYPQDYPIELQLLRLPAGVELERIDAIDIYRLDGQVVAYTAQGRVAPLADTAEVMRQALTVPGYELEFWLEQSSNRPGDFTARWSPSPA
jgi:hypothetical protein